MQQLEQTRYYTGNSWNGESSLAYNLKIRHVIDRDLEDRAYQLLTVEEFASMISELISEFDRDNDYQWQAGMNGRSGGWLVLYKGGCRAPRTLYPSDGYTGENDRQYSDLGGWKNRKEAEESGMLDYVLRQPYVTIGSVDEDEVPLEVKQRFRKLAEDIVWNTEELARNYTVEEETVYRPHKINVLRPVQPDEEEK